MTGSDGAALAGDIPSFPPAPPSAPPHGEDSARRTHPVLVWYGAAYGAMERVGGCWMMSGMERSTPQEARESLAWWLRNLAEDPATSRADGRACREGAALLERGCRDQVTAAGRVFRVVRADRFCRFGLDGPERPRPTDPDALPEGRACRAPGRFDHGPIPPPADAEARAEAWTHIPRGPGVPPEVTRDARRAVVTHPAVVRVATRFAAAERANGAWPSHGPFLPSPAEVREHLAAYFDMVVPKMLRPSPFVLAEYRAAARLLRDGTRRSEVTVLGRLFRIIRVVYAVRIGADGPETPRPSDHAREDSRPGERGEVRGGGLLDGA
ncbi:MAG TPA: DUF5954 family protein [Spirillospora sp.]